MQKNDVSIRIIGKDKLDFNKIRADFPFKMITHSKGDILHKHYVADNDVVLLEFNSNESSLEDKIKEIVNVLSPYKKEIEKLKKISNVILRIYIESDMAQMYCYITNHLLELISNIKLDIEISIFSEGLCDNE